MLFLVELIENKTRGGRKYKLQWKHPSGKVAGQTNQPLFFILQNPNRIWNFFSSKIYLLFSLIINYLFFTLFGDTSGD